MPGRHFLFVPGPTNVPDSVLSAMHRPMEDHRSPVFPQLMKDVLTRLPKIFGTTAGRAVVLPASGSGMWEAALVNTLDPGARLLAPRQGLFSHLFIQTAKRLGYNVDVIEAEWGAPFPADAIREALARDTAHAIQGVLAVHNETSTGVTSNMPAVRQAIDDARHPALLYVDGVSSIASLDFRMDEWKVDLAIAGSQKGFMLPPGLGILALSPKALARIEAAKSPRSYFDLRDQLKQNETGYTPFTPALSLLYGLQEALNLLRGEGMDRVAARHKRLADGVRAAVSAWGLCLCAKDPATYSNTVSAVMVPNGLAPKVMEYAFRKYQLSLGAGLGEMSGKLFRIGHLGDLNALMILGALSGVEMALRDAGVPVKESGVVAAQEVFRATS